MEYIRSTDKATDKCKMMGLWFLWNCFLTLSTSISIYTLCLIFVLPAVFASQDVFPNEILTQYGTCDKIKAT